jgi:demethylmenaquinone methyltransferase/2-methoxy-6-polyprenyl-1,4-benzoquinol methylase
MSKTMDKRAFFDSLAAGWDGHPEAEDAPARRARFVALAAEHHPTRILDVGSGTGVLVPELLAQCPSSTIVELDFAAEMIARNQAKHSQPHVVFICSSIDEAPIDLESFDAVLCFNVIPHLDSLDTSLRRLVRLLRPGGRLSVGHLMGSAELNAFHAEMEGPIRRDHLPPVEQLAGLLELFRLRVQIAEERPDWYFLRAEKPVP